MVCTIRFVFEETVRCESERETLTNPQRRKRDDTASKEVNPSNAEAIEASVTKKPRKYKRPKRKTRVAYKPTPRALKITVRF